MWENLTVEALFTLTENERYLMGGVRYPWEALAELSCRIVALGRTLGSEYRAAGENIFVHKTARVSPSATLFGPCIVGRGCEIRQGAFLRGGVYLGEECVVGNCSELKNCMLLRGAKTPHFNYVGDAVLGEKAHLGAGAIVSNLKADGSPVGIVCGKERMQTGLKKCGAFLGDGAEIGCNAVLNPGTVVGKNTRIYPLTFARGVYPPNVLVRSDGSIEPLKQPKR